MSRRPKVRITARKRADARHEVVSTLVPAGRPFAHSPTPCAQCPWRRDSPIGAFPAEAYRISAKTAYDMAESQFACHMAGAARSMTCAGFLLRGADHNMSIRKAVIFERYRLDAVSDGGHPLYDSYREMAIANGVSPDDPVLKPCR